MNDQRQEKQAARRVKKPRPVRDCALYLLERSDKTAGEMRQKLREREYQPEEIEETMAFLEEYHYVDDREYVRKYIRTYSSRKSIRRIRAELEQKGVDEELIDAEMAVMPVDEEAQIVQWLRKKGYEPGEPVEWGQYRRLTAALGRRGYSYEAIRRATERMHEEQEDRLLAEG
ncbi:regulatory protein RecX [bacterium D16-54]|nr:regulatory protein RecX [bacterium D16-54]RKJ15533.1 regulatory protein RecX [bacterium D16-56]